MPALVADYGGNIYHKGPRPGSMSEQDDADAGGDGALKVNIETTVEVLADTSMQSAVWASQAGDA